jgi:diguanylate cyclase (GGDEF)-like protein
MMRVSQFILSDTQFLVISNRDITEQKLAEQEVSKLTSVDDINGIPNRRVFAEFLDQQWVRAVRMKTPIFLGMLNIDHFKKINDTYGQAIGDGYLRSIGAILSKSVNRPDDICARYGGDEFAILLGGTEKDGACSLILKLLRNIRALKIPNEQVKAKPI